MKQTKLFGVWLEEIGKWGKNRREVCKRADARVSMLTKLKYAEVGSEELLHTYKLFIHVMLEYCSVDWHSSLLDKQSCSLELCKYVCLPIILGNNYVSYEAAIELTGLQSLSDRRQSRSISL